MGRRVAEANCNSVGSSSAARGFSYAYIGNRQALPAVGQAIGNYQGTPGNGEVRSPNGRVVRGGLGTSAYRSAGS